MDLTETLTFELRSKTIKPRFDSANSYDSGEAGDRQSGDEIYNASDANSHSEFQVVGFEQTNDFSGSEIEPAEDLTKEFIASEVWEPADLDSICEFESLELPADDSTSPYDEKCDIETADEEVSCAQGDTLPFVPDALEGTVLDHFYLQKRVGSGGMARVYLANDRLLRRDVAIKVIQNRKFVTDEHLADLLMSEAVAQAQLNHANIVSIHYVGKIDGMPFLAMEYVGGQSLEQRLASGALPISEAIGFSFQIIDALLHAASHNVVHGDIKPANLLIDHQNRIKLSDFGLARQVSESKSHVKKLVGTPSHMAPELFDKRPVDKQSDLYALGVTMFQMIFNRFPYELAGETAEEVKLALDAAKIRMPETWPEDIPVSLRPILTRLLEKDRDDRYRCLGELKADLEAAFGANIAPAKTGIRCVAMAIDNAVYAGASLPFWYQVDQFTRFGDWGNIFANSINFISLLMLPCFYMILSVLLRRTIGQIATQARTIHDETIAIPIAIFFRREVIRTLPIWGVLVAIASPSLLGFILGVGCFVAAIAAAGWVRYRSEAKTTLDVWFGTSEMVWG